jgi:hypothetical protein
MSNHTLTQVRKTVLPKPEDTWDILAARDLPDIESSQAVNMLQSWNLHVFMRPAAPEGSPQAGKPFLPSDMVFVEAPKSE